MNQELLALGLFVIGFTFLYLMPASFQKNWDEIGSKPPAGDGVVFMLRIMGALAILAALALGAGVINVPASPSANGDLTLWPGGTRLSGRTEALFIVKGVSYAWPVT